MAQFDPPIDPAPEPASQPRAGNGSNGGSPNLSIAALPTYPVLDLRVLPEPVANDEFADTIPVLTDLVVAGTTGVRETLPEAALRPAIRPEDPQPATEGGRSSAFDLDASSMVAPVVEHPPTGDAHYPDDQGIDLRLDQSLIDEFVNAVEQGITRSIDQRLTQRLAEVASAVTAELRDEIRTLVRGYADAYLAELLSDRAENPAPERGSS